MKILTIKTIIPGILFSFFTISAFSQPIPIGFLAGHQYLNINVSLSKNFSDSSKIGFFHMTSSEIYYENKDNNDLIMQNLLFYEIFKSFRITGGVFYGRPGFLGTVGIQYIKKFKSVFIFLNPRLNFDIDLTYDLFGTVQYTPKINSNMNFLAAFKILQVFTAQENVKTQPELRLGFDTKAWQFGLGASTIKRSPDSEYLNNYGVFIVRKLL